MSNLTEIAKENGADKFRDVNVRDLGAVLRSGMPVEEYAKRLTDLEKEISSHKSNCPACGMEVNTQLPEFVCPFCKYCDGV